jgi:hypothetical protein
MRANERGATTHATWSARWRRDAFRLVRSGNGSKSFGRSPPRRPRTSIAHRSYHAMRCQGNRPMKLPSPLCPRRRTGMHGYRALRPMAGHQEVDRKSPPPTSTCREDFRHRLFPGPRYGRRRAANVAAAGADRARLFLKRLPQPPSPERAGRRRQAVACGTSGRAFVARSALCAVQTDSQYPPQKQAFICRLAKASSETILPLPRSAAASPPRT